ncbi:hypothetical protein E1263_37310 [Kribbella antibiotica]|uniref:Uncharacterized protein n=1 Tax=Kribbella antibiotica TaxID=190195 RepID=A0A4R4YM30_9ACTN|nr:DUF5946 family protein [Kribbella antibiotica]TDD46061.1 hypothetical protein E1263_37310 [Kribbella antibiotica]
MNSGDDTRESTRCPGCRAELPVQVWDPNPKINASAECLKVSGDLLGFEIEHQLGHLHQLRMDAYHAQHVRVGTPRIGPVFALNGLYMFLERGSGNIDVRTAHGIMANSFNDWPELTPPAEVGRLTAYDVLAAGGPAEVEQAMLAWAAQVWESWPESDRDLVRKLTIDLVPARYFQH